MQSWSRAFGIADTVESSPAVKYGVAFVVVLAAAALRWLVQPILGAAPPYITFYLAVVVAAAYGGFRPGVFATVLGGLFGVGLATWPGQSLDLDTAAEKLRLLLYLLSGLGISLIAGAMHHAQQLVRREAAALRQAGEELRQANALLQEVDRAKSQFLAVLAHELRNPLMPIKHSLYLLDRVQPDSATAKRARATLDRQVDQLARLVDDLLDVTRINHDKLELHRTTIDLRSLLRRVGDDHRPLFNERDISLEVDLPQEAAWVLGDQARLTQTFGNLLHNALKFTPRRGGVCLVLAPAEGHVIATVRDTGIGIAPDMAARVFEPFAQVEQKLDRAAGGLGLGLTLVKRLVEMHGGNIEVRSEGLGKGAEFRVSLPLVPPPAVSPGDRPANGASARRRILLIEDNVDSAQTLCALLELDGHTVTVAHSGTEGVARAKSSRPDIVLCDIGLPGMDGYEVAAALREAPETARTRLIALTGYASAEVRDRVEAAGFDMHLVKPASAGDLASAVGPAGRHELSSS